MNLCLPLLVLVDAVILPAVLKILSIVVVILFVVVIDDGFAILDGNDKWNDSVALLSITTARYFRTILFHQETCCLPSYRDHQCALSRKAASESGPQLEEGAEEDEHADVQDEEEEHKGRRRRSQEKA